MNYDKLFIEYWYLALIWIALSVGFAIWMNKQFLIWYYGDSIPIDLVIAYLSFMFFLILWLPTIIILWIGNKYKKHYLYSRNKITFCKESGN